MRLLFNNDRGFTLIELLIALTIFAIGLLAIAKLQVSAIRDNTNSSTRTLGASLAQGVVEEVLSRESDDPLLRINGTNAALIDPDNLDGDGDATTLKFEGAMGYTASWTVTADSPVNQVSQIVVNVVDTTGRTTTLTAYKRYIN